MTAATDFPPTQVGDQDKTIPETASNAQSEVTGEKTNLPKDTERCLESVEILDWQLSETESNLQDCEPLYEALSAARKDLNIARTAYNELTDELDANYGVIWRAFITHTTEDRHREALSQITVDKQAITKPYKAAFVALRRAYSAMSDILKQISCPPGFRRFNFNDRSLREGWSLLVSPLGLFDLTSGGSDDQEDFDLV